MTHDNNLTTAYADLLEGAPDPAVTQIIADLDTLAATGEPPTNVDAAIAQAITSRVTQRPASSAKLPSRPPRHASRVPRPDPLPVRSRRRQFAEIAVACVAFALVTLALVAVFRPMSDDGTNSPGGFGGGGEPTDTEIELADYRNAILDTFAPLPDDANERNIEVDVEANQSHDNAFGHWTSHIWQRWIADGEIDEGVYIVHDGLVVAHIVLNGQQPLMEWEPENALEVFDVPTEYSLQRRVFGATLAAATDPSAYEMRAERVGASVVLHFQWTDHHAEAIGAINLTETWFDSETHELQRIVYLLDHPDSDPYPVRTFSFKRVSEFPAEPQTPARYELHGAWPPLDMTLLGQSPAPTGTATPLPATPTMVAPTQLPTAITLPEALPILETVPVPVSTEPIPSPPPGGGRPTIGLTETHLTCGGQLGIAGHSFEPQTTVVVLSRIPGNDTVEIAGTTDVLPDGSFRVNVPIDVLMPWCDPASDPLPPDHERDLNIEVWTVNDASETPTHTRDPHFVFPAMFTAPAATSIQGMDAVEATWTAQAEADTAMWQQLRSRPFVIPTLAPDGSCGQSEEFRLGQEPIYVQGEISHSDISRSYRDRARSDGLARYKVVWWGSPEYAGPALVRGHQIDGSHDLRFDFGDSSEWGAIDLQLNAAHTLIRADGEFSGWRTWHGHIAVPAPGCYAMQVDGFEFSYTIVIEVPD